MPTKSKPTKNIRIQGYGTGWKLDAIVRHDPYYSGLGGNIQGHAWSMPLQPGQELICLIRTKPKRKNKAS